MDEESLLPGPVSLKFHSHSTTDPDDTLDKSVKQVGLFSQLTLDEKDATGSGENEIGKLKVDWHPEPDVAVNVIVLFKLIKE